MLKQHLTTKEFLWTALIFWAACFTAMEAPFSFVFHTKIQNWQLVVDFFLSIFFIADLVYHIKERKKLEKENGPLKSRTTANIFLVIDFLAAIPFDIVSFYLGHQEIFMVVRLLRLFRIIKVYHLIDNITIVPTIFRVQAITLGFFMVVNWIACGWILIYPFPSTEPDITTYYIKSFYWAITTLTTVGYGDITPTSNWGRLYTSFIMLNGILMYGIVVGSITRMISNADKHKEQSREKISDLMVFMKHYMIPAHLQRAAINHYSHIFSNRLSDNDEKIIADLPHALQNEMHVYMKIKLISGIAVFNGCSQECLIDVANNLEQLYASPGDMIIKIGDIGDEMFILSHGSVDVFINPAEKFATLRDGQIFGEVALLKETTRNANVQAQAYCDLYKLTSAKFKHLIKDHPQLLANIESTTNRRKADRK